MLGKKQKTVSRVEGKPRPFVLSNSLGTQWKKQKTVFQNTAGAAIPLRPAPQTHPSPADPHPPPPPNPL